MPITRTERNLWSAFIDEAKANRLYAAYAQQARDEGMDGIAALFEEASTAESVHAAGHLKVAGEVKTTVENLHTLIRGEAEEIDVIYPRRIREAESEGRPDAAASFRRAWEEERRHLKALEVALNDLLTKRPDLQSLSDDAARATEAPTTHEPEGPPPEATFSATVSPQAETEVLQEKERVSTMQRLREVVFGAQDGLVSTVAVTSSVAVATGDSAIVVVAGATSALAGMVSMAAGSYLGSRAQQDVQTAELAMEEREIAEHPAEEMAELIALYRHEGMNYDSAIDMAERISADKETWLNTMAEKELGITPTPLVNPWKDSLTMGVSFIAGAIFPVMIYLFLPAATALLPSVILTLVVLFLAGGAKGILLKKPLIVSGLEVAGVGALSGILGYALGNLLPGLLGIGSPI